MSPKSIVVFSGSPADADLLIQHRQRLWQEVSSRSEEEICSRLQSYREWLMAGLGKGDVHAFVAKTGESIAGSCCVWVRSVEPKLGLTLFAEGYLMAMYTEPAFRRMGVASALLKKSIDFCRERGVERIVLHSSEYGKPLYEKFGFTDTTEMRLDLA